MGRFSIAVVVGLFWGIDSVRPKHPAGRLNRGLRGRILVRRRKPVRPGPQRVEPLVYRRSAGRHSAGHDCCLFSDEGLCRLIGTTFSASDCVAPSGFFRTDHFSDHDQSGNRCRGCAPR